jgi:hypothetical protein
LKGCLTLGRAVLLDARFDFIAQTKAPLPEIVTRNTPGRRSKRRPER